MYNHGGKFLNFKARIMAQNIHKYFNKHIKFSSTCNKVYVIKMDFKIKE